MENNNTILQKIFIQHFQKQTTWIVKLSVIFIFLNLCIYIQSFIKLLILCIGVVYPALNTYSTNNSRWKKYWIVYSAFSCCTHVFDLFLSNGLYVLVKLLVTSMIVFPTKNYDLMLIFYEHIDKYLKNKKLFIDK